LETKIHLVDITSYLCPHGVCQGFTREGDLIYLDNTHISASSARRIGQEMDFYIGNYLRDLAGTNNL